MKKNHKLFIQGITLCVILIQIILSNIATLLHIIVIIMTDILVILLIFVYEQFKLKNNSNQ